MNSKINNIILTNFFLLFISIWFNPVYGEADINLKLKYGKYLGKGEGSNEFNFSPGLSIALSGINQTNKTYRGVSLLVGYQELKNEVNASTTSGKLYTPFQFDILFSFFQIKHMHWTMGFGYDLMKFDNTSDYDNMFTFPIGLVYRKKILSDRYIEFNITGKYVSGNSLEQDLALEFAISTPIKKWD